MIMRVCANRNIKPRGNPERVYHRNESPTYSILPSRLAWCYYYQVVATHFAVAVKLEEADAAENEEWLECLTSALESISALCADLKKESSAKTVEEFCLKRHTTFFK